MKAIPVEKYRLYVRMTCAVALVVAAVWGRLVTVWVALSIALIYTLLLAWPRLTGKAYWTSEAKRACEDGLWIAVGSGLILIIFTHSSFIVGN